MTAQLQPLFIEQGATYVFAFEWRYDSEVQPGTPGDLVDLTGAIIRMQIRKAQQTTVLVEATTEGLNPYISHNGVGGTVTLKLPASETNKLSVAQPKYDLEIELPGGDVFRAVEGDVTVSPNITQMAGEPKVK